MKLALRLLMVCGIMLCGMAGAQTAAPLNDKPWDIGVWGGGGFSVPGGTTDTKAVNAGIRLGKVLTHDHLGSFLRGNFEWSADLLPIYYLVQPTRNAFGAGFNPLNLKWNFTSRERVVPYLELGGGALFTNREVPANTSTTNFLTHGAFGLQFFTSEKKAVTVATRFEHISNAGLSVPNPGINTVQFTIGLNWFK